MTGNNLKAVPYTDEGMIIVISALVSSITSIFVNNMLIHAVHPLIVLGLVVGLIVVFISVLVFFRRKKQSTRNPTA